nr:hypothetical protein GCM10020092_005980 [Actinoplanes digitatis]
MVSLLSVVLLLAVVAAAFVVRPGPVDGWLAADPTTAPTVAPTPEPTPTPVLAAVGTSGAAPTAEGVKAAIGPLVDAAVLGPRVNVSVVDTVTGESLFLRRMPRPAPSPPPPPSC